MTNLFISLLLVGTTSLSIYLTPSPVSRRSPFHFLHYFFLIAAAVVGMLMTLPFLYDWRLPLQQGLGSNQELLVRGLLLAAAALFAVIVKRVHAVGSLPVLAAIGLLAVGIPELLRVLDILNSTVNGMLNYGNSSMKWIFRSVFPYLLLFLTDVILISLGILSLISSIYRAVKSR
jgi:hypothetical protein